MVSPGGRLAGPPPELLSSRVRLETNQSGEQQNLSMSCCVLLCIHLCVRSFGVGKSFVSLSGHVRRGNRLEHPPPIFLSIQPTTNNQQMKRHTPYPEHNDWSTPRGAWSRLSWSQICSKTKEKICRTKDDPSRRMSTTPTADPLYTGGTRHHTGLPV